MRRGGLRRGPPHLQTDSPGHGRADRERVEVTKGWVCAPFGRKCIPSWVVVRPPGLSLGGVPCLRCEVSECRKGSGLVTVGVGSDVSGVDVRLRYPVSCGDSFRPDRPRLGLEPEQPYHEIGASCSGAYQSVSK